MNSEDKSRTIIAVSMVIGVCFIFLQVKACSETEMQRVKMLQPKEAQK